MPASRSINSRSDGDCDSRIIEYLNLRRPIFKKTAAYGHFGRNEPVFTWEATSKTGELKAFFKR